jgi:hypothetical protein
MTRRDGREGGKKHTKRKKTISLFNLFSFLISSHRNLLAGSGLVPITPSISSITSCVSLGTTASAPRLSPICSSEVAPKITVDTLGLRTQKAIASCASEQSSFAAMGRSPSTLVKTSGFSSLPASIVLYFSIERRDPGGMFPSLPYFPESTPDASGDQVVVPVPRVSNSERNSPSILLRSKRLYCGCSQQGPIRPRRSATAQADSIC